MTFLEHLEQLPAIEQVQAVVLLDSDGKEVVRIPNAPGKRGSLKIYHALLTQYGALTPEAAQKGLEWFAEKVDEAKEQPGAHPNIDRLFDIVENKTTLSLRAE
ncbi:conserved hypothetical protein [gamma proteobacterium HTCC5015]|nr:conserved hypothetical protein [gamma proteobacterium HTCC5015]